MAKARRNLTQLNKDNRTSNVPSCCSKNKCDEHALLSYPLNGDTIVKRVCAPHYFKTSTGVKLTKKQKADKDLLIALGVL